MDGINARRNELTTQVNFRGNKQRLIKSRFEGSRFTLSGNSDQTAFADTEAGQKSARELREMRSKYKRFTMTEGTLAPLTTEQKTKMQILKHNMKESDMSKVAESLPDAEEIATTREHASAYISADVVDRASPQDFTNELREAHDKVAGEVLLRNFERSFPEAAGIIRANPPFLRLVREAGGANVKFGGLAERGPLRISRAYCIKDKVYVSQEHAREPGWRSVTEFLFELNNAISHPRHEDLDKRARDRDPSMTRSDYAYGAAEIEVDSMLHIGHIWHQVKEASTDPQALGRHDNMFFQDIYRPFVNGERSKQNTVLNFLRYPARDGGTYRDLFERQFDMQQRSSRR